MITLFALTIICTVSIFVLMLFLTLLAVPLAIIFALLPWFLRLGAIVLLIRALLEQPITLQALLPAAALFVLSILLG